LLVFTEPMATSDKWNELNSRFIYALLVIGVIVCSITFLVHTATKNTSRHCSVYVVVGHISDNTGNTFGCGHVV
jgi:hypothetical protein